MFIIANDKTSSIPKYQQIVDAVTSAIEKGKLKVGDKIPSVNEVSESTGYAKKTVVQAFDYLKETGIISSVQYKGFYVSSSNTRTSHHIFLLFNRLTAYKEAIYEGIKMQLGDRGTVDIFFHHNNVEVFDMLIEQNAGKHTAYVIMPIEDPAIGKSLEKLPRDKVYILDLGYREWGMKYPSVCQHFEEDIYEILSGKLNKIRRYDKLVLVIGESLYNIKYTVSGFKKFCRENSLSSKVIYHAGRSMPQKGELYIIVDDNDLICLVKKANSLSLKIGKDVGIISYNDIPFKEIAANGISTISADFMKMGGDIVGLILNRKKEHLRNAVYLVDRNSF